jgi:hypothetical protein
VSAAAPALPPFIVSLVLTAIVLAIVRFAVNRYRWLISLPPFEPAAPVPDPQLPLRYSSDENQHDEAMRQWDAARRAFDEAERRRLDALHIHITKKTPLSTISGNLRAAATITRNGLAS